MTSAPSAMPTAEPSAAPTLEPTTEPTDEPTYEPTAEPTNDPTAAPTEEGEVGAGKGDSCFDVMDTCIPMAAVAGGSAFVVLVLLLAVYCICKGKKMKSEVVNSEGLEAPLSPKTTNGQDADFLE